MAPLGHHELIFVMSVAELFCVNENCYTDEKETSVACTSAVSVNERRCFIWNDPYQHIGNWTKRSSFCRQQFEILFVQWKLPNFHTNVTEICSIRLWWWLGTKNTISHYLNKCWPWFMMLFGVARLQCLLLWQHKNGLLNVIRSNCATVNFLLHFQLPTHPVYNIGLHAVTNAQEYFKQQPTIQPMQAEDTAAKSPWWLGTDGVLLWWYTRMLKYYARDLPVLMGAR